tara:strand:+ start:87 stop:263 length:177 start_codon:yes stop_codon:yes gene_type:complete
MIRIMVKYTMEIPEDKLEKYCHKVSLTRGACKKLLKDMGENAGRIETYKHIDKIINGG